MVCNVQWVKLNGSLPAKIKSILCAIRLMFDIRINHSGNFKGTVIFKD